jgi:hypothetical protein
MQSLEPRVVYALPWWMAFFVFIFELAIWTMVIIAYVLFAVIAFLIVEGTEAFYRWYDAREARKKQSGIVYR